MYFRLPKFIKRMFPMLHWNFSDADSIFITFDDGPHPKITPWVLDQLKRYDAKATFFCIGKNVEQYPEVVEKIKTEGHSLGNHSYSHIKGWGYSAGRYIEDVDLANGLIHTTLFRPPYGRISLTQIRRVAERNHIIMWDILSRDYSHFVSPKRCVKGVVKHLRGGSVIVFHDSVKASRNLYYALPIVLEEIRKRGFTCKAIEL